MIAPRSISSACIASGVPSTTALRYIDVLVSRGLASKVKCSQDGRKSYLEITDKASEKMERVYRKVSGLSRTYP